MKIAVIGVGAFSTAFATLLEGNKDNDIFFWTEQESIVKSFKKSHKFEQFHKTNKFTSNINVSNELSEVLKDASLIFIMVSSKYYMETIQNIKPFYEKDTPIFVGTKGMDYENNRFFSEQSRRILKCNSYNYFSGPNFAKEMILDYPSCFTIAGTNKIGYQKLFRALPEDTKMEFTFDLYGLELMGILKNICAIGTGILSGLKVPSGLYYAVLVRMIRDIENMIGKVYGSRESLFTHGGLGDLLMTSNGKTSRNYSFGKLIGSCAKETEIEEYLNKNTVEGYESLQGISAFLKKKNIKCNYIPLLYSIVFEKRNPNDILSLLDEKRNN